MSSDADIAHSHAALTGRIPDLYFWGGAFILPTPSPLRETNGADPRLKGFLLLQGTCSLFCQPSCLSVGGCGGASAVLLVQARLAWMHHGHVCVQGPVPGWYRSIQQHQFPRAYPTTSVHLQGRYSSDQSSSWSPQAAESSSQGL